MPSTIYLIFFKICLMALKKFISCNEFRPDTSFLANNTNLFVLVYYYSDLNVYI